MRRGMRRAGNHIWGHYLSIILPPGGIKHECLHNLVVTCSWAEDGVTSHMQITQISSPGAVLTLRDHP